MQDDERIAVYIRGAQCINRAVDGDIVAFELLPEAEWGTQSDKADVPTTKASSRLASCDPCSGSHVGLKHDWG